MGTKHVKLKDITKGFQSRVLSASMSRCGSAHEVEWSLKINCFWITGWDTLNLKTLHQICCLARVSN